MGIRPDLAEHVAAVPLQLESVAREILREYLRELEGIRNRLETLAASLARMPVEDPERISPGEELQAGIVCVLHDTLRPAIDDLRAMADSTAAPDDEEAETA